MFIHVTENAAAALMKYVQSPKERIRLVYDSEGCGCAVSGVVSLWLDDSEDSDEAPAESNHQALPLYYLRRQKIFFEDAVRLDYLPERRAFRLSSDGQIYGNNIRVTDRRAVPAAADAPQ